MAESDFDKTVKLPAGSGPGTGASADKTVKLTAPPPPDQTVKLSPQDEKTVRLAPPSPTPPPQPPQPAAPSAKEPASPALSGKGKLGVWLGSVLGILAVLAGGVWTFAPGQLEKRAQSLAQEGKHSESAKLLQWAVALRPLQKEKFLLKLGRELRLSEDYAGSQKALEEVLAKSPSHLEALKESGFTDLKSGQVTKAFDKFQKAVQINGEDLEALQQAASLSYQLKDYTTAVTHYEKLTRLTQASAQDWLQLGAADLEIGKAAEAEQALKQSVQKDRSLKGAQGLLAKAESLQGKWAEALAAAREEWALQPSEVGLADQAAGYALKGGEEAAAAKNWDEALRILQEGLTIPSRQAPQIQYWMAKVYASKRDRANSALQLTQALRGDPSLKPAARKDPAFAAIRRMPSVQRILK